MRTCELDQLCCRQTICHNHVNYLYHRFADGSRGRMGDRSLFDIRRLPAGSGIGFQPPQPPDYWARLFAGSMPSLLFGRKLPKTMT
jgi:hypothetical protein